MFTFKLVDCTGYLIILVVDCIRNGCRPFDWSKFKAADSFKFKSKCSTKQDLPVPVSPMTSTFKRFLIFSDTAAR